MKRTRVEAVAVGQEHERPSRSARKRAAEGLQKLGERLLALRPAQLLQVPMPPHLRAALAEAARVPRGPAQARARQYIGRLMRELDDPAPIIAALAALPGGAGTRAKMPR